MKSDIDTSRRLKGVMEQIISSPVMKSFLAGSLSGTCSTLLFQPLDLVKTRLQSPVAIGQHPLGMLSIVGNVVKTENILALWKGLTPSITRCVPGIGMYFCTLHSLKNTVCSGNPSNFELILLGASARTLSGVSMIPFTVIKCRYESGFYKYRGITAALVDIYKSEGAKGLCSGLGATLLRDAPFSGIYLMFYTQTKKMVSQDNMSEKYRPVTNFSCGVVAGAMAAIVTQPADVIKTHMQLYPDKYSKFRVVVQHIYKTEGYAGFMRGIVPRTIRRTLMAAMAWTVYEQIMKSFGLKS